MPTQTVSTSSPQSSGYSLFNNTGIYVLVLLALFVGALGIRLIGINRPPSDFWTVRQYNALHVARWFYVKDLPTIPEWRRQAAQANAETAVRREPPIIETTGALLFKWLGRESYTALKIQPVLAWLLGGLFLLRIARRLMSRLAAVVAVAVYLFLPYGVAASRSLQPESFLVMGLLLALWLIQRYDESPTLARWLCCGLGASLAIFFKPGVTQFAIWMTYGLLALNRAGVRSALLDFRNIGFLVISVVPTLLYIAFFLPPSGDIGYPLLYNFKPVLLGTVYFWRGWLGNLIRISGAAVLFLGVAGWILPTERQGRLLLMGVVGGYVLQCFLTIVTTASHDYWHMQIVPAVAVGLGLFFQPVFKSMATDPFRIFKELVLAGIGCVCLALVTWGHLRSQAPKLHDDYLVVAADIGQSVYHSTKCIILDYDMGIPLRYFAEISGWYWPESQYLEVGKVFRTLLPAENPDLTAQERFERFFAARHPEYFIVCRAMRDLDRQPGLRQWLAQWPVVRQTPRFVIYKLGPA